MDGFQLRSLPIVHVQCSGIFISHIGDIGLRSKVPFIYFCSTDKSYGAISVELELQGGEVVHCIV